MNAAELAEIGARHTERHLIGNRCRACIQLWPCDAARLCEEVGRLRDALGRLAFDPEVRYMACSDLPYCGGGSGEKHQFDCAVGIAQAALAAQPATEVES